MESFLSPCSLFPRLMQVLLIIPPVCLWSPSIFPFSATPPQIIRPLPLASQVAATLSPASFHLIPSPIQFILHMEKPARNTRITLPPPILNPPMVPHDSWAKIQPCSVVPGPGMVWPPLALCAPCHPNSLHKLLCPHGSLSTLSSLCSFCTSFGQSGLMLPKTEGCALRAHLSGCRSVFECVTLSVHAACIY